MRFGTAEWAQAVGDQVRGDAEYRAAAKGWGLDFNGNILFSIEPADGLKDSVHLLLELKDGDCLGSRLVGSPAEAGAGFTLRGPLPIWKQVLGGEVKPLMAISLRKIRLDGSLVVLMRYVPAAQALVRCVAAVPTEFP